MYLVLPLAEVDVLEYPVLDSSSEVHVFKEGQDLFWPCRVTAGEDDNLQWLHNGVAIPSFTAIDFTEVCNSNGLTVWESFRLVMTEVCRDSIVSLCLHLFLRG